MTSRISNLSIKDDEESQQLSNSFCTEDSTGILVKRISTSSTETSEKIVEPKETRNINPLATDGVSDEYLHENVGKSQSFQKFGSAEDIRKTFEEGSSLLLQKAISVGESVFGAVSQGVAIAQERIQEFSNEPEEVKLARARDKEEEKWKNRHYDCCTSSRVFHATFNPGFVFISMATTAAAGYLSMTNLLNQGVLSPYSVNGIADRSSPEKMLTAFIQSSMEEQRAFLEAIWFNSMFVVGFAMTIYSLIRMAWALPQWIKVLFYSSCIPLVVIAQWTTNTCEFFMYIDFQSSGIIQDWPSQVWPMAQIATWVAAGFCGIAVVSAAFVQMIAGCGC